MHKPGTLEEQVINGVPPPSNNSTIALLPPPLHIQPQAIMVLSAFSLAHRLHSPMPLTLSHAVNPLPCR
jgi:hypothetical protein